MWQSQVYHDDLSFRLASSPRALRVTRTRPVLKASGRHRDAPVPREATQGATPPPGPAPWPQPGVKDNEDCRYSGRGPRSSGPIPSQGFLRTRTGAPSTVRAWPLPRQLVPRRSTGSAADPHPS